MCEVMEKLTNDKVRVTRHGVALFNATWPASKLRSERAYWFEFDEDGNLIDTDVPEQDDGPEALALSQDAREFLCNDELPDWAS